MNWSNILPLGRIPRGRPHWMPSWGSIISTLAVTRWRWKCGTFALHSVARELHRRYDARSLLRVPSPATGFSMKALADISSQLGLGLVAVTRTEAAELVVPSVVHWRQN